MIKNIAIVSLSSGILGESFIEFEKNIGVKRLEEFGIKVQFMPHALSGMDYIKNHPEKRAEDLLEALRNQEIDMILCAIGGDDTYRLLPYLFENDELKKAATDKVFLGFSDTTINHLMFHKIGMRSFYGQAFLPDVCELAEDMLPYTKKYFQELISTGTIREITPSDVWYEERTKFAPDRVGTSTPSHPNQGFELLQGPAVFSGKILGGCIESMYDCFCGDRYEDMPVLCRKYHLFPDAKDWEGRIILLETSEERPAPKVYKKALEQLKATGLFDVVSGVLAGKPQDEIYADEYKKLLVEVIDNPKLPILFNVNIGHATPRCIIPFGVEAIVDATAQVIRFADKQPDTFFETERTKI
ncbi:MAG: LD-carboxypeptidase [Acetatifactor sp.]|nr:LD-carboxypeptidase [Acetatifactor sp.]